LTQYNRLSPAFVKNAPPGKHNDGAGLWLIKRSDGGAQWVLRISLAGKRREMGLGGLMDVPLKEARELAQKYRKMAKSGTDPIRSRNADKREALRPEQSLEVIALAAFEARKAELKNDGTNARWFSPLALHVLPKMGKTPITEISQQDVAETLRPIWHEKGETARKAINRLNIVFQYAAAMGLDVDMNAIAKAKALLGKSRQTTVNIPAMHWSAVPVFYASLAEPTITNLALRLLILTGVRSFALRHINLNQIDNDVWTIPSVNMKGRIDKVTDFRVPLSKEAIRVISEASSFERDGFLFPGTRKSVISDATLSRMMGRRDLIERPHGFRSSLRTWLAECTSATEEVAEKILAHTVGSKVVRAYRRTDHLELRRILMERWAEHVCGTKDENVIGFANG
jgi:integrase